MIKIENYECDGQLSIFDCIDQKESMDFSEKSPKNRKKEIIEIINNISGKYSAYEVFTDWIRCSAISICNFCDMIHDDVWKEREQNYLTTIQKYSIEERAKFGMMMGMLAETLENKITDVLGEIYMESGMGSKAAGQFFTPYHISKLCADLQNIEPDEAGKYIINEPSCGGGGMVIAMAASLKDNGIDYQKKMYVVAQDLDWKGVYMCYLQLSLLGIKAVCIQGNTLEKLDVLKNVNKRNILRTPAEVGLML